METNQSDPILASSIKRLQNYRQSVYNFFPARADAQMDLLDALSSNVTAESIVELSQNPLYRRGYSSISDSIDNLFQASSWEASWQERESEQREIVKVVSHYASTPRVRRYWLFVQDATSMIRRPARSLADRSDVYTPYAVAGNAPVNIGHSYLVTGLLLERSQAKQANWLYPLLIERICSDQDEQAVAAQRSRMLQTDSTLPWHGKLSVQVADSKYAKLA